MGISSQKVSDADWQFWTGKPFKGSTTDGSQLLLFDDLSNSNRLSGPSDFDDGRCADDAVNPLGRKGPINCQSHFTIPAGTAPGIYALYWVWDFTKLTAIDPSYLELYTSCMDVEVVASDGSPAPAPAADSSSASYHGASSSASQDAKTPHAKTVDGFTTTTTDTVILGGPTPLVAAPLRTVYTKTWVTMTVTV
jgi:hypothetical protein